MKRAKVIAFRRPKGTRARASLTITMHAGELAELERRAARASLSLTAYVRALLLESDADDLPASSRPKPRINWLEDNSGATFARRCGGRVAADGLSCALVFGHEGACSSSGPLSGVCVLCLRRPRVGDSTACGPCLGAHAAERGGELPCQKCGKPTGVTASSSSVRAWCRGCAPAFLDPLAPGPTLWDGPPDEDADDGGRS